MGRGRLVLVACLLGMCCSGIARGGQQPDVALVLSGIVDVRTAADCGMTIVSVDVATPTVAPDGIVDYAFRVQHDGSVHLGYQGMGQVTFKKDRLIIAVPGGDTWTFHLVDGIGQIAATAPGTVYPAFGLARFWGTGIHQFAAEVFRLLTPSCGAFGVPLSVESCEGCQAGGPGEDSCGIGCGDVSCSASCRPGTYACCRCPGSCRCCG